MIKSKINNKSITNSDLLKNYKIWTVSGIKHLEMAYIDKWSARPLPPTIHATCLKCKHPQRNSIFPNWFYMWNHIIFTVCIWINNTRWKWLIPRIFYNFYKNIKMFNSMSNSKRSTAKQISFSILFLTQNCIKYNITFIDIT